MKINRMWDLEMPIIKRRIIAWLIKKFLPGYKLTADIPDLPYVADWIKASGYRDLLVKQLIGRVYNWERHLAKNPPKGGKRNHLKASSNYEVAGE